MKDRTRGVQERTDRTRGVQRRKDRTREVQQRTGRTRGQLWIFIFFISRWMDKVFFSSIFLGRWLQLWIFMFSISRQMDLVLYIYTLYFQADGSGCGYLYPDLRVGLAGEWREGRMVSASPATISSLSLESGTNLDQSFKKKT